MEEETDSIKARIENTARDVLQRAMELRINPIIKELEMKQANSEEPMDSESSQVTDPTEKS